MDLTRINRRVNKEVNSYWLSDYDSSTHKEREFTKYIGFDILDRSIFFESLVNNYAIYIKITFSKEYPFRPPRVWVNNYYYKNLLRIDSQWTLKYLNKTCICCSSILCNWCVSYGCKEIINEIRKVLDLKLRINEIKLSRQVVKQKIGTYVPVEEFL